MTACTLIFLGEIQDDVHQTSLRPCFKMFQVESDPQPIRRSRPPAKMEHQQSKPQTFASVEESCLDYTYIYTYKYVHIDQYICI